jgi:hypothetical protein
VFIRNLTRTIVGGKCFYIQESNADNNEQYFKNEYMRAIKHRHEVTHERGL